MSGSLFSCRSPPVPTSPARIYYAARACLVGWGYRCPVLPGAVRCCPVLPGAARCCPAPPDGAVRPICATLHCSRPASKAAACGHPGRCATMRHMPLQPAKAGAFRKPVAERPPPKLCTGKSAGVATKGRWRSASPSSAPGCPAGVTAKAGGGELPGSGQGVCPTVFRDPVRVGCEAVADKGTVPWHVVPKKIATDRLAVCCNF